MSDAVFLGVARRLMRQGTLDIGMPDGTEHRFGDGTAPAVRVTIHDPRLPGRLVRKPDMALGEGYMDGGLTIEGDDLRGLLTLAIRNWKMPGIPVARRLSDGIGMVMRNWAERNSIRRSVKNVAHHYDLTPEFYDLFLDEYRQYSCAYFRHPDATLEDAQLAKMAHIGRKLRLKPGMRVLDIGSGWGTLAISLARNHGARVTGVTLSRVQLHSARARAAAEGMSDHVTFRLMDYRDVNETFDRVVSVGMMEHVGRPQYATYFRKVADCLSDDGIALVHSIGRSSPPGNLSSWFRKYIFPGGYSPSLSEVLPAIEGSGLTLADVEVWRGHYERTLQEWQKRFEANVDRVREMYDDRFVRMWRFYLIAAELSFSELRHVVFQMQLSKGAYTVPATRDYLYD